jgi:hypothetical protein
MYSLKPCYYDSVCRPDGGLVGLPTEDARSVIRNFAPDHKFHWLQLFVVGIKPSSIWPGINHVVRAEGQCMTTTRTVEPSASRFERGVKSGSEV